MDQPNKTFTKDDLRSLIGEGFHTMLRKGIDGHGSGELWKKIFDMPDDLWVAALDEWVVNPVWDLINSKVSHKNESAILKCDCGKPLSIGKCRTCDRDE